MKVTKELYRVFQNNNSKLLKKVETFLDSLDYSVPEEDELYIDTIREYSLNTYKLRTGDNKGKEMNQFSCSLYNRDSSIHDFNIEYTGYISKEKTFYEKTIWGRNKKETRTILEVEYCILFPFVDSIESIREDFYLKGRKIFIEVEEFKKYLKSIEHLNPDPIEYEKIEPVLKFVSDIILDFKVSVDKTKNEISNEIKLLDRDNNGIIDVIEGNDDFMSLFKKHQKKIIEVDKNYIQHFVKLSTYLKTKRENIQNIFTTLKESPDITDLKNLFDFLKNQIHTYELLLFHSLNMITSVVEDDLITFYEIYESFDN